LLHFTVTRGKFSALELNEYIIMAIERIKKSINKFRAKISYIFVDKIARKR